MTVRPVSRSRQFRGAIRSLAALGGLIFGTGCGGLLPSSEEAPKSPWTSFEEAKAAYDSIEPSKTTAADLKAIGYDPYGAENVRVLSYLDVLSRFLPQATMTRDDLDPALRDCLAAREACWAIEVAPEVIDKRREGFVLLDVFGFRRETITTGWRFSAIVVIEDDVVRYKVWDGTPSIEEQRVTRQPLGPLQNLDEIVAPRRIIVP